jgi:hypothetical protein
MTLQIVKTMKNRAADCHSAECHSADRRGTLGIFLRYKIFLDEMSMSACHKNWTSQESIIQLFTIVNYSAMY